MDYGLVLDPVSPPSGPCFPNPCQNGGTCTAFGTNYECGCATGYDGRNCEGETPFYAETIVNFMRNSSKINKYYKTPSKLLFKVPESVTTSTMPLHEKGGINLSKKKQLSTLNNR